MSYTKDAWEKFEEDFVTHPEHDNEKGLTFWVLTYYEDGDAYKVFSLDKNKLDNVLQQWAEADKNVERDSIIPYKPNSFEDTCRMINTLLPGGRGNPWFIMNNLTNE